MIDKKGIWLNILTILISLWGIILIISSNNEEIYVFLVPFLFFIVFHTGRIFSKLKTEEKTE